MKPVAIVTALLAGMLVSPAFGDDDREEAALALYAMNQSGITVLKALDIAEQAADGIVHEYELDEDDGALYHEFKLVDLQGSTKIKLRVAVRDGAVTRRGKAYSCALSCNDDDVQAAKVLSETGFNLRHALEQFGQAPNVLLDEAKVELRHGVRYLKLETVGPEGERDRLVDIDTGQLIPSLTRAGG